MKTLKIGFSLSAILIFVLFSNSYLFASPDIIAPAQSQVSVITQTGQPAAQEWFTPPSANNFIEQYKLKNLEDPNVNGFTGNGPELFAGKPYDCYHSCCTGKKGKPFTCVLMCYKYPEKRC